MQKRIPPDAVLVPDEAVRVFQGQIFDVYQWPQRLFDGSEQTFEMLKRTDTVSVIAVADDRILMLDDEQPHLGHKKTFPGGRVDPDDESMLTAAQRELLEETGYRFKQWRLVRVWQPYAKIEWFIHLFLAWDVAGQQALHLDAGEKINLTQLNLDELKQLITTGAGHLGEVAPFFGPINSLDDLLALPEFQGQSVDR